MVADHALPRLAEFRPAGLAKLMYGLANMGYDDELFFTAASDRWAQGLRLLLLLPRSTVAVLPCSGSAAEPFPSLMCVRVLR